MERKVQSLDGLSLSGRVEWRFRLRWAPGGEEFIMPNISPEVLEDPWWRPPYKPPPPLFSATDEDIAASSQPPVPSAPPNFRAATQQPEEPEDHVPTTSKYRQARLVHHEYQFRHHHFRELYESLLPTYLLAPFGKTVRDLSFPRGWLCNICGKVNYQRALRHRYCTSTVCKGKVTVAPYALSLFTMRDPQDRLPVSLPYNTYPSILEPEIASFDGG
ncbi:hypothetical protein CPB84DRAFT_143657 [Gymnopilus junonius]|uniref:Uncharacterized protein n=1 Tax=Gymnopilus junonius TaxID=109634 RepID=A0A9P5NIC9_GYMJU|nr:hypothetical protein CPB84DRAFT_143657 [Gymnopilus junonius]